MNRREMYVGMRVAAKPQPWRALEEGVIKTIRSGREPHDVEFVSGQVSQVISRHIAGPWHVYEEQLKTQRELAEQTAYISKLRQQVVQDLKNKALNTLALLELVGIEGDVRIIARTDANSRYQQVASITIYNPEELESLIRPLVAERLLQSST